MTNILNTLNAYPSPVLVNNDHEVMLYYFNIDCIEEGKKVQRRSWTLYKKWTIRSKINQCIPYNNDGFMAIDSEANLLIGFLQLYDQGYKNIVYGNTQSPVYTPGQVLIKYNLLSYFDDNFYKNYNHNKDTNSIKNKRNKKVSDKRDKKDSDKRDKKDNIKGDCIKEDTIDYKDYGSEFTLVNSIQINSGTCKYVYLAMRSYAFKSTFIFRHTPPTVQQIKSWHLILIHEWLIGDDGGNHMEEIPQVWNDKYIIIDRGCSCVYEIVQDNENVKTILHEHLNSFHTIGQSYLDISSFTEVMSNLSSINISSTVKSPSQNSITPSYNQTQTPRFSYIFLNINHFVYNVDVKYVKLVDNFSDKDKRIIYDERFNKCANGFIRKDEQSILIKLSSNPLLIGHWICYYNYHCDGPRVNGSRVNGYKIPKRITRCYFYIYEIINSNSKSNTFANLEDARDYLIMDDEKKCKIVKPYLEDESNKQDKSKEKSVLKIECIQRINIISENDPRIYYDCIDHNAIRNKINNNKSYLPIVLNDTSFLIDNSIWCLHISDGVRSDGVRGDGIKSDKKKNYKRQNIINRRYKIYDRDSKGDDNVNDEKINGSSERSSDERSSGERSSSEENKTE